MQQVPVSMREWHDVTPALFHDQVLALNQPAVLRGLVRDWPVVKAAGSPQSLCDYLGRFDSGGDVPVTLGAPEIGGKFFYDASLSGFNFERRRQTIAATLRMLLAELDSPRPTSIYMSALPEGDNLPGFAQENVMPLLPPTVGARVWIGNRVTVQTHYDLTGNIACVVAGRRRFTLFPPEQVANLYVGPLEFTLAGAPTSMVDIAAPDFERHPRFREALAQAQTAELGPGDAIYIPYMWWHHVEALSSFNLLVNYWWADTPRWMGSPFEALIHGMLAIRSLSPDKRAVWRAFFDQYVFQMHGESAAHLPQDRRGVQGAPSAQNAATMRAYVLERLVREQMMAGERSPGDRSNP